MIKLKRAWRRLTRRRRMEAALQRLLRTIRDQPPNRWNMTAAEDREWIRQSERTFRHYRRLKTLCQRWGFDVVR